MAEKKTTNVKNTEDKKNVAEKTTSKPAVRASKKKQEVETKQNFEDRDDLKNILFYTIIVNYGQGNNIVRILKSNHCSAVFVKIGEGTATKQIRSILQIEDNRKEIVYSFIREEYIDECKREIEAFFAAAKRNAGVAFTIKLSSIVGVKMYKFLTQTVRG